MGTFVFVVVLEIPSNRAEHQICFSDSPGKHSVISSSGN